MPWSHKRKVEMEEDERERGKKENGREREREDRGGVPFKLCQGRDRLILFMHNACVRSV